MNLIIKIKEKLIQVTKNLYINKNKRKTLFTYILLPIILNIIVEMFSRESILKGLTYFFASPIAFICNMLIILMTLMISVFFRRRIFCLSFISFIWLFLGFTNFILLSNRVTPFNATDILLMKPAIAVITKYYKGYQIGLIIAGIVLILCFIILLWFKAPKLKYKINYIRNIVITVVVVAITFSSLSFSISTGFMSVQFDNLANAYMDYGFPYCFSNSVFNTGVSKPDNYSEATIDEIINENETSQVVETTTPITGSPNVIFLQLESFFDVNRLKDVVLSQNPIPNFTSLQQQYTSGFFNVPIVGAGTANTEFEVLTGMNLDDFGPGEYPYKTVLQETTSESASTDFKANGYYTHAIHNNDGTFYQRHTVFSQLGFDTFTPIEYMNNTEYTYKGWATDKILTEEIMKSLTTTEGKDYIYTISVEGHGSYPTNQVLTNPEIKVEQIADESQRYAMEYYVNLLHDMDKFIGELISTLSAYNEDVILVMYGDHLPSLDISDSELSSGNTYQTNYVIWNNMNLSISNEDVEAYQMSSKIMELLGIKSGVINQYHQTHKGTEQYLNGLKNLEYDILYGDKVAYNGVNPYIASNLQMGVNKIKITEIIPDTVNPGEVIIKGENFTKFSKVFINNNEYDTEFLDANTLRIKYEQLISQDVFKVGQQGEDGIVLGYTDDFIYN